jgi:hypothetical protein
MFKSSLWIKVIVLVCYYGPLVEVYDDGLHEEKNSAGCDSSP